MSLGEVNQDPNYVWTKYGFIYGAGLGIQGKTFALGGFYEMSKQTLVFVDPDNIAGPDMVNADYEGTHYGVNFKINLSNWGLFAKYYLVSDLEIISSGSVLGRVYEGDGYSGGLNFILNSFFMISLEYRTLTYTKYTDLNSNPTTLSDDWVTNEGLVWLYLTF